MPLTTEQRAARRNSIGGSDLGAIAGVSPHKSPMQLYLEKLGLSDDGDQPQSDVTLWGELLEEGVAKFYAYRHAMQPQAFDEVLVHPSYSFLTANPDRVIVSVERLLEIKTTGAGGLKYWRDPEATQRLRPPQHVILQVNWYLGFLGWQDADIVLLNFAESHSIERYHEFQIIFDEELFELSLKLAVDFWENNVKAQVPPEAQAPEDMAEYLTLIHPRYADELLSATDESTAIAKRLSEAKAQKRFWEEQATLEANGLKALIGDKAGMRGADWLYTWKETKSGGVDWQSLARSFHPTDEQIARFTRKGYRREYFRYNGDQAESQGKE